MYYHVLYPMLTLDMFIGYDIYNNPRVGNIIVFILWMKKNEAREGK